VDGVRDVLDTDALDRLQRLGLVDSSEQTVTLTPRGRMLGGGVTADLLA
jgi:Mn-dependent DtxR family transcriptional regulator